MYNAQNLNYAKWINWLLPPPLRTQKTYAYLHSLLAPLQTFRDGLSQVYQPLLAQKARYNSQVIVFEKVLNTEMGATGIYINDAGRVNRLYLYNQVEGFPKHFFTEAEGKPVYIGNSVEYNPAYDFTVNAPQTIVDTQLSRLKGLIDKYKLVGVNYQIVGY